MKTKNRLATFGAALAAIIASTGIERVAAWARPIRMPMRSGWATHGNKTGKTYPLYSKRECDRRIRQAIRRSKTQSFCLGNGAISKCNGTCEREHNWELLNLMTNVERLKLQAKLTCADDSFCQITSGKLYVARGAA